MSERQVREFLIRLERAAGDNVTGLKRRHEAFTPMYSHYAANPGSNFIYVGESVNLETKLIGTEQANKRNHVLSLMFRERGRENRCLSVQDAINFEDFESVLNRFERTLLSKLADGCIGPAYDSLGNQIEGGFTVWRYATSTLASEQGEQTRELATAGR